MVAVFIGHSECYGLDRDKLKAIIIEQINQGICEFLSGGMGNFDLIAASIVHSVKSQYPYIENNLVIPYLKFEIRHRHYYDTIIYPEGFEKYHFKAAIPKRNCYMVDKSDVAICYVQSSWGGAAQTLEYAKKKGVKIFNLGD